MRRFVGLLLALAMLAGGYAGAAENPMQDWQHAGFGPLFPAAVHPVSFWAFTREYERLAAAYGDDFFTWPHGERAYVTWLLEIAGMEGDYMRYDVPGAGDLADAEVEAIARQAVAAAQGNAAVLQTYELDAGTVVERTAQQYGASVAFAADAVPGGPVWLVELMPIASGTRGWYQVRIGRDGAVLGIDAYEMEAWPRHMSPYLWAAVWVEELLARQAPGYELTLAERKLWNARALFGQYGDALVQGEPAAEAGAARAKALVAARGCVARMAGWTDAHVGTLVVETGYLLGETGWGQAGVQADVYPCWQFLFLTPGEKDLVAEVRVDAVGDVVLVRMWPG